MTVDLSPIDENLLAEIANMHGMPKGAFNVRKDGELVERHSSAYIDISTKTDNPGIDLWSLDRLTETFRDIHEARDGRSIVIISHQERIISPADEIVLLRDGQVAETGTPAELMPRLGFAARSLDDHGCPLSTPTELHLTEIPTTC